MGRTSPARVKAGRFFFSQYRRRAVEPDAAARNCDDVARIFVSKTRFTGSNPSRSTIIVAVALPGAACALPIGKRLQVRSSGHFKPINSPRFLNDCHEYVFHFTKSGRVELNRLALGVPYQDKSNIARWSHTRGKDLRCRGNTWFVPYETIQSREKERPHPATFPVRLAEWCIKLHGASRVGTMLDPFLGIGNSAVAAQRCGVRRFIGFEIDDAYLAEAKRRIVKGRGLDLENERHLASIDRTAPTTSSVVTAFMQRKSIGHSRRKQGLHST